MTDLTRVAPGELGEARLVAHWALQIPAAVASQLVPVADDDSHSNFGWSELAGGSLLSHPLSEVAQDLRVGMSFDPLEIVVVQAEGLSCSVAVHGKTVDDLIEDVRARITESSGSVVGSIELRDYEMPAHAVSDGNVFAATGYTSELAQLRNWFETFDACFAAARSKLLAAEPERLQVATARVWPHHFDLGGLVTVAEEIVDAASGRLPSQLGFGLSPGDHLLHEPYVYVSPYPGPPETEPWSLPDGWHWESDGFNGAMLPGAQAASLEPDELREQVSSVIFGGLRIERS